MSFEVTVTPTVYDVEVEVNPSVQPFDVEVIANNNLVTAVEEARQYAEDAENSADSASNSASSASASASNANNFANSASSSASSASASESTATTQAGIATTQAGIATTKANEASQSESNAFDSEQSSAQSASDALQSEQNAFASAQASAQSEANALSSQQSASASASTATTQAGIATTQAGIATTQAGIATTQASNALNSANAAAASAASAAAVGTSTVLTGFSVGANTAIAGTDTILQAFNKTQGQINARVSGIGVSGQVSFWTGTGTQSGDNGLWWDNGNKRFGIGTNTPEARFHTFESGNGNMFVAIQKADTTSGNSISLDFVASTIYVPTLTNYGGRLRYTRLGSNGVGDWDIMSADSTGAAVSRFKIFNGGNVLIQNGGTFTDAGYRLDVNGTTRLNGLQTFQGTTASDTAPLGTELATTGSGTNWTGTDFATGYTHAVGSTAPLTTSIPAVSGTYYQIAYTVTGRTAGSFTINYGGTSTSGLTSTGATGPRATSTADLEIVPTTDFDGTVVLSVRSIGVSSATTTINDSGGNARIQIRATSSNNNTVIGIIAGRRITTGISNSFYGNSAGQNTTTGINNSFFGQGSGAGNTIGVSNCFFGVSAGVSNITGSVNSFFGTASGAANTTGSQNSFFGVNSGLNLTSGNQNVFLGNDSGRRNIDASNLTLANNSILIGFDTRTNADNETNQIVIGNVGRGLGSNTTVIGNSSTTFGRWWGSLLVGTSTNEASSILTLESTTRGFLPPRMTGAQAEAISSPAEGLLVYSTDGTGTTITSKGWWGFNGSTWAQLN